MDVPKEKLTQTPLILVVDDERPTRLILRRAMESEGYRTTEATNGREAIAAYQQERPDLVLLDALMPEMDGFTCCQHLQTLDPQRSAPVLMVTGLEDEASVDRAFEAGATDYITKPLHRAVLRNRIRRMLREQKASNSIKHMLQRERELSELRSRIITVVSHEFRTPLTTILFSAGLLETYADKWETDKRLNHIHRIQSGVERMSEILEDVLLFSQAEAGQLPFEPQELDLVQLCDRFIERFRTSTGKQHQIVWANTGEVPARAHWDPQLLDSMLENLMTNAVKYSQPGGTVTLELHGTPNEATFIVRDEGIGIPETDYSNLFDTFYRASNAGNVAGTGLGLAIVKKAVDLQGGTIGVTSQLGVGSTFIVRLPVRTATTVQTPVSQ
jgi:signal transduction histidine kinase